MDNAEILHFKFDSYKIWMQKFCGAIFPLNSLKNQQQMDNAEILHFNFEKYKIWMHKNSAELHFAKFDSVAKLCTPTLEGREDTTVSLQF